MIIERISLRELRENALRLKRGGGVIEDLCAEHDQVLALVEAVEVAWKRGLAYGCPGCGVYQDHPLSAHAVECPYTRFDFGESA